MALTSLSAVKTALGVTGSDLDALLSQLISAADAAIKQWLHRDVELASYTDFLDGSGRPELLLRQRPVAATPAPQVWIDAAGYYGQAPNAFAAATQQTLGTDFVLKADGPAARGESGILLKIGSGAGFAGGMIYPSGVRRGTLSGWDRAAVWPTGTGNVKVVYTAGYATVPSDVQTAANLLVAQLKVASARGWPMASENMTDYAYVVLKSEQTPEMSHVRGLLSHYRELAV